MKYTKEQRLDIGKKIYTREINVAQASEQYDINLYTARDYMRLFRDINDLPPLDSDSDIQNSSIKSKHATLDELGRLSKQQLIAEVIKARIEAERAKKRLRSGRGWANKGIHDFKEKEFEVIYILSNEFPAKTLCKFMDINRSSFYKWRNRVNQPSAKMMTRISNILLFKKYHNLYPNHGYRWLNAKIKLDLGLVLSDRYAHHVCKYTGIASISKRFKFKKPGEQFKIYANLLSADMNIDGPYQCVVSDMTAFWCQGIYYELTIYMDLWNNEIISYGLAKRRGDRNSYLEGLKQLIEIKKSIRT